MERGVQSAYSIPMGCKRPANMQRSARRRGKRAMTKTEAQQIDQSVAEGLKLIGLSADSSETMLPSLPTEIPSQPTLQQSTFYRMTIGNSTNR